MYAFDAVEFDVAGGRGAADPGQGTGGVEAFHGFGDDADDPVAADDAQVVVGDQSQGAAALVPACVEDDRAGLGDQAIAVSYGVSATAAAVLLRLARTDAGTPRRVLVRAETGEGRRTARLAVWPVCTD